MIQCEVEEDLKMMRPSKVLGADGKGAEILEVLGEWEVEAITKMANCIYNTGRITITKKPCAIDCNKLRKISVMSELSKSLSRFILNIVRNKVESEKVVEQHGLIKGKGT